MLERRSREEGEGRTDAGGVVRGAKDKLWCSVVPRADVADVGLSCDEDLRATEIAEFENAGRWIEKQVLWLDISMTDADGMDVCKGAEKLIHVQLDLKLRHGLLGFDVVPAGSIDGLRHKLENEIQVDFVLL